MTTAYGVEIENAAEDRITPQPGNDLYLTLDVNIQKYAEQAAYKVMEAKGADNVKLIVMNPNNGEIYAMVNAPEFDLNNPYNLINEIAQDYVGETLSSEKLNELLNGMWRNACISDTYEPGSAFKIVTTTAALEEKAPAWTTGSSARDTKGSRIDNKVPRGGHGSQSFVEGIINRATRYSWRLALWGVKRPTSIIRAGPV